MPTRQCLKGRCSSFVTQWITRGDAYRGRARGWRQGRGWGLRWLVMDGSGPLLGFGDSKPVLGKGWTTQSVLPKGGGEIHTMVMTNLMIESVKKKSPPKTNKSKTPLKFYIWIYGNPQLPPIKNQRNQKDATRQTSSPPLGGWDPILEIQLFIAAMEVPGILEGEWTKNPILFYGTYNKHHIGYEPRIQVLGSPSSNKKNYPPVFPNKSLAGKSIVNRLLEGFTGDSLGMPPTPPKKTHDKWTNDC